MNINMNMEMLILFWDCLCIYSSVAFFVVLSLPDVKTNKGAYIQILLSGLIGWAWFLFVSVPKNYIQKRKAL